MRTRTELTSSPPEKLHTIPEVAAAIGCHPVSLYKAANGQLAMPAPRTIRIGRLLRVRDCDFQAFLAGLTSVKTPVATATATKKKMGRPTKAAQIARRDAASASNALARARGAA